MTRPPVISRSSMVDRPGGSLSWGHGRGRCGVVMMALPSPPEPHPSAAPGQIEPGAEHGPRERRRRQGDPNPGALAHGPEHPHGVRGVDEEAPRHQEHAGHEAAAPAMGVMARLAVTVVVRAARPHEGVHPDSTRARQAAPAMPPMASGPSAWFTEPAW